MKKKTAIKILPIAIAINLICLLIVVITQAPPFVIIGDKAYFTYSSELNLDDFDKKISDKDIDSLKKMKWVKKLTIKDTALTNISFLYNMKSLEELHFTGNNVIKDYSPLSSCKNLEKICVVNLGITDLSIFKELTNLKILDFGYGNILTADEIKDISDLQYLVNLEDLSIYADRSLTDISPISNLKKLKTLYLQNTSIEDVSALADLSELEYVNLRYNPKLTDISALKNCKKLKLVNLKGTNVARSDVAELIAMGVEITF